MKDTKVAIIGQGRSGRDIHGAYIKSEANKYFDVVAVVELDPARRELAAKEWEGAQILSDYKELYGRSDIDLVVNATYSEVHYSISMELMSHGLNVLVEKPMARNRYECDNLIKCAEDNGVVLAVFQQTFFAPFYVFAKEIADSGKLGKIQQINLTYNSFARRWDWQTLQCKMAGSVYNTGPHPIGMALGFLDFDEDAYVAFSRLGLSLTSGDSDDYAKIVITAANKPVIDVEMISSDAYPEATVKIIGTRGTYKSTTAEYEMKYIVDGENVTRPVVFESMKNEDGMPTYCSEELITHEESGKHNGDAFNVGTDRFYTILRERIKNGTPLEITPEHAARIISVIEKVHADNPLPVRY